MCEKAFWLVSKLLEWMKYNWKEKSKISFSLTRWQRLNKIIVVIGNLYIWSHFPILMCLFWEPPNFKRQNVTERPKWIVSENICFICIRHLHKLISNRQIIGLNQESHAPIGFDIHTHTYGIYCKIGRYGDIYEESSQKESTKKSK